MPVSGSPKPLLAAPIHRLIATPERVIGINRNARLQSELCLASAVARKRDSAYHIALAWAVGPQAVVEPPWLPPILVIASGSTPCEYWPSHSRLSSRVQPRRMAFTVQRRSHPGRRLDWAYLATSLRTARQGPPAEVRVVTTPSNGVLAIRSGKAKIGSSGRCPNVETPIKGVFYQPNPGFTGRDEVAFEVKSATGKLVVHNVEITVKPRPASPSAKNAPSKL